MPRVVRAARRPKSPNHKRRAGSPVDLHDLPADDLPPGSAHGKMRRAPKGTISGILRQIAREAPELYRDSLVGVLKSRDYRAIVSVNQLAASYLDGKPIERVQVESTGRLFVLSAGARVDVGHPDTFAPRITPQIAESEGLRETPLSLSPENTKDSGEVR